MLEKGLRPNRTNVLRRLAIKRATTTAVALAVAMSMTLGTGTSARAVGCKKNGRTYWASSTSGMPLSTEVGTWAVDGGSAKLEFDGGHVLGDSTKFLAGWVTPWPSTGTSSSLEASWSYMHLLAQSPSSMTVRVRSRECGQDWTSWSRITRRLHPSDRFWNGGIDSSGPKGARLQYEIQMRGSLHAPAFLRGSWEITVS